MDKCKTRDLTALILVLRDGEEFYQWPLFWLPERTAEQHNHEVPFLEWARAGFLNLIPGEVVTDAPITETVAELSKLVRIQLVRYDRTFAHDVTLAWEQALGIPRVEFPQTTMMLAGPVEDYERHVIQGTLRHPNNPVLNWQAGHCKTYSDSKGRKTLVKPRHGDVKKIDGMVAGVMEFSGALQATPATCTKPAACSRLTLPSRSDRSEWARLIGPTWMIDPYPWSTKAWQ